MIRIVKPTKIPKTLTGKGARLTAENKDAYDNDPVAFISAFTVDSKVYGSKAVKKALRKAQHNKCCFCEKDQVDEYGAVEHYRPKAGYKINRAQKDDTKPGYYWLAYDWSNLFFVCGTCNTSYKSTLFPLQDENLRATSHKIDTAQETPLLLDPTGTKDPRDHIYFNMQFPMYKTAFGQSTIEICGLDRDDLNNKRAKHLANINRAILILAKKDHFSKHEVQDARDFINEAKSPAGPFSSAALDYLAQFTIA